MAAVCSAVSGHTTTSLNRAGWWDMSWERSWRSDSAVERLVGGRTADNACKTASLTELKAAIFAVLLYPHKMSGFV
jgi:hypothetical protein